MSTACRFDPDLRRSPLAGGAVVVSDLSERQDAVGTNLRHQVKYWRHASEAVRQWQRSHARRPNSMERGPHRISGQFEQIVPEASQHIRNVHE